MVRISIGCGLWLLFGPSFVWNKLKFTICFCDKYKNSLSDASFTVKDKRLFEYANFEISGDWQPRWCKYSFLHHLDTPMYTNANELREGTIFIIFIYFSEFCKSTAYWHTPNSDWTILSHLMLKRDTHF